MGLSPRTEEHVTCKHFVRFPGQFAANYQYS